MNEMNVAFIIVVAMSSCSLSCFLWQTATALMISSAQNSHAYHPRTAIAALISDVQASLQHNDLTKPPSEPDQCPCTYLMAFFSPLPLPESGDPTHSTPGLFLFPWKTERRKEEVYSLSNWSQASPPPTSARLALSAALLPDAWLGSLKSRHLHSN